MADDTPVIPVQCFYDDQYGWIEAHKPIEVEGATAKRWIEEGKAVADSENQDGGNH